MTESCFGTIAFLFTATDLCFSTTESCFGTIAPLFAAIAQIIVKFFDSDRR
ncbi:MAG: hypothetical protein HC899_31765 [Leptolyngbyaceae cyanobacterium SM1_4_3]|nr:hypothetical protein [Leptolyngbyaceae cyanobacterium SM1_4_3]